MTKSVKVIAPASVANIGCGYDTIGFALEGIYEELIVTESEAPGLVIESVEGASLSLVPEENVATVAASALLKHVGGNQGFSFQIKKLFLPGSGLGSSASSAAGAVFAVNQLLPSPLETRELLPFALEGEAYASKCYHADNVAPSLLGGCISVRSYQPLDYFHLPLADELKILIARPYAEIKTAEAKGILPTEISVPTARNQWGNLASLIHALHEKDWDRLSNSIEDYIAEPVRKSLIPCYDKMKEIAMANDSVGYNISGSGPSVFAFFETDENLLSCKAEMESLFKNENIDCDFFETRMSAEGCRVKP
ncbi:MAG: homoserine kinase [Bacteroidota bacterium]